MDGGLPEPVTRRLGPVERYGLRLVLLAGAIVVVTLPFGLLLEQVATDGSFTRADLWLARWLHGRVVGRPVAVDALQVLSFLGKPIFLAGVVVVVGAWLVRQHSWRLITFLVVTAIGGGIVDSVMKVVVARPRPRFDKPVASAIGKSFPSGHAMSSTIVYGSVLLILLPVVAQSRRRPLLAGTALLLVLIGLSRLALGVHYLTDVAGGWLLGAAWLSASVAAFETWRVDRGQRATGALDEGLAPEELAGAGADGAGADATDAVVSSGPAA
ncbi:MAG: phosphatase PAP2 family protein [Actinobacteria bacterium]|nr:phosphatase PAP2 family protein [Actinomycetota bacterium]